jgi:hypothetical protein
MSSVSEHGERERDANDDDSDDDNEFVDADDSTSTVDGSSLHRTSSGAEKNLIGALRALERTVNTHCTMLGRRLTREPTVKSVPPPPVETSGVGRASVSGGSAPKTAIRGDKVTFLLYYVGQCAAIDDCLHFHSRTHAAVEKSLVSPMRYTCV